MRLVQNPICDKLADHRVLCSIAMVFFVAPVVMAIRDSRAEAQHAQARPGAPEGHVLDLAAYLNMALAVDGVLDTRKANPVNAPWL